MRRKALTGPLQHLCLWAVVLLFGAFSAFAPGTMPERQQGALTMVLCTGYGVETATIGPDGEPVQPEHKPCDWNQHSLAALRRGWRCSPWPSPSPGATAAPCPCHTAQTAPRLCQTRKGAATGSLTSKPHINSVRGPNTWFPSILQARQPCRTTIRNVRTAFTAPLGAGISMPGSMSSPFSSCSP